MSKPDDYKTIRVNSLVDIVSVYSYRYRRSRSELLVYAKHKSISEIKNLIKQMNGQKAIHGKYINELSNLGITHETAQNLKKSWPNKAK